MGYSESNDVIPLNFALNCLYDAPDPGKKGVLIVLPGDFFRIHWKWYYIAMTKIASRKKNKFTRNSVQSKFTL